MNLDRRTTLALGAAMLSGAAASPAASAKPGAAVSKSNPIANRDQQAAEELALKVWARGDVQAARKQAAFVWAQPYGATIPAEAQATFESAMDEWAFNFIMKAAASDANYPRPVRLFLPPHSWFGHDMPGTRIGGDNPDNCYRVIAISGNGRYRVEVKPSGPVPADTSFSLMSNWGTTKTIASTTARTVERAADGSFVLSVDADEASGRPNHLRSAPEARFLFVRDSMGDWSLETPLAIRVTRLDPVTAPPIDEDEVARRAIGAMIDEIPLYYWYNAICINRPVNALPPPINAAKMGGLISQSSTIGWFSFTDEEALVIRVDPAGAAYQSVVLHDWWFRTIDYPHLLSTINLAQAKRAADGTYTVVASRRDPGTPNWLETGGLHRLIVAARWQGLPGEQVRAGPAIDIRKIAFADIGALALGPKPSAGARSAQREIRLAGYMRRLAA
jgi:hypothetical protein